jgi:hypothetical protein
MTKFVGDISLGRRRRWQNNIVTDVRETVLGMERV